MKANEIRFPDDFLWGTATSAHQVEGGNTNNDWWEWEQTKGRIKGGATSQRACDHYNRYGEDWRLARSLGQNAHRLSVEWSRIEPQEGMWDESALAHYRESLLVMRDEGLQPMVTLHHFTNPRWFVACGGWENERSVRQFTRFVTRVVSQLEDLCTLWVTINEPMVYYYEGYLTRRWPPGKGGPLRGLWTVRNMLRAHAKAYRLIHAMQPAAQVGVAHNMRLFDPLNPRSRLDRAVAAAEDRVFNRVLLWALADGFVRLPLGLGGYWQEAADSLDFVGLNYYTRDMVSFSLRQATAFCARNTVRAGAPTDLFGWEIYAEGLYRLLMQLADFGKPIYVTESGLADAADEKRPRYIVDIVRAMWRAMQEGAPVKGYFHWSLLDNFEWAEGYSVPFGLVAVDPSDQERTVKHSGRVYQKICQARGVDADLGRLYPVEQDTPS